jgi:hypothetical protein
LCRYSLAALGLLPLCVELELCGDDEIEKTPEEEECCASHAEFMTSVFTEDSAKAGGCTS